MSWAVRFLAAGAGLLGTVGQAIGQDTSRGTPAPSTQATKFQSILWLHGGPARDAAFFAAVKTAGYTAVSVSSGEDPSVPGRHGLDYYHDQICGKGVLELRQQQYRPVMRAYENSRDDTVLLRPACLAESATLVRLIDTVGKRLGKTLPEQPWAISLGDEISVTRHANPLDLCFAPATLGAFRKFLAARYRTIDALNAAWGTDFASFARARPFTADAIRQREFRARQLPHTLTPWADHREFMDRELARTVGALLQQIRRHAKDLPAGLTGLQQPSAYGGHDYARLLPLCRFYEVYDIGGARDLAMSLAPPEADQVATMFAPEGPVVPVIIAAQLADLIAHGMSGVVVWSAGLAFDRERKPTPFGTAWSQAMQRLRPAADQFAGATLRRSAVWMVESQASVRAWWMLDSAADGPTWIKRLSSYEAKNSTSLAARHAWIRLFEDLGLQPLLVPDEQLVARLRQAWQPRPAPAERAAVGPRVMGPRVIVLPATVAMSDAVATAIGEFVRRGGVVLADHTPGLYDERLRLREAGALDQLFGVVGRSDRSDRLLVVGGRPRPRGRLSSGGAVAESGLRAEVSDPQGDFQVQLENTVGRGRTCYLNLAVCEYGAVRLDPKRLATALDIRWRVRSVLRQAGVVPPVFLSAKGMPTCLERMVLQARSGARLLAIRVNALEAGAVLRQLAARGPVPIELTFPVKTMLRNVVTGQEFKRAIKHTMQLDPVHGLFLETRSDD